MIQQVKRIPLGDVPYPTNLGERLGAGKPEELSAVGNLKLLALPKLALFCSTRCPGKLIIRAFERAAQWRDGGRCIISGFHSPVESECLPILLRGKQPIVICPARSLEKYRIPLDLRPAFEEGRLLFLSPFGARKRRATAQLAQERNEFVAALADEVFFIHISPGGQMEQLSRRVAAWGNGMKPPED